MKLLKRLLPIILISSQAFATPVDIAPFRTTSGQIDKVSNKAGTGPVEFTYGATGTGGEINLVKNSNQATGWAVSGAGITVATTTTSSELPTNSVNAIKITPSSGTPYVKYCAAMPQSLRNTKHKVQWVQHPLSGYATSDLKVDVYGNTAADCSGSATRMPLSTDSSAVSSIQNFDGRFTTNFDADGSLAYEIRINRVAGSTALVIANVVLGPGIQPQTAVVSGSQSITPTFSSGWGTTTNTVFYYERVGSWMHLRGKFTAGTTSAALAYLSLPAGFTINYSAITTAANLGQLGTYYEQITSSSPQAFLTGGASAGALFTDGSDTSKIYFAYRSKSVGFEQVNVSTLVNASNFTYTTDCWVPISEWAGSGNVNLSQNEVEYAYSKDQTTTAGYTQSDDGNYAYGPAGITVPAIAATTAGSETTYRVRFLTPIQPTDVISLEFTNQGATSDTWYAAPTVYPHLFQGTSRYGAALGPISGTTTDYYVWFGNKGSTPANASYAGNGDTWSGPSLKYRLKKAKSTQAVGFGIAANGNSGLIPYYNEVTNTVVATGESAGEDIIGTFTRIGRVVTMSLQTDSTITLASGSLVFAQLVPAGFRHTHAGNVICLIRPEAGGSNVVVSVHIKPTGDVEIFKGSGDNGWTIGNTFRTADSVNASSSQECTWNVY